MSRYDSDADYDERFPNEGAFWQANAERALKGKRGRRVLRQMREALLALPEPRLVAGAVCTVDPARRRADISREERGIGWQARAFGETVQEQGEGVCAVGAYLWHQRVKAGADPAEAFDTLPTLDDCGSDDGLYETAMLAKREAGVVFSLAWSLAYRNDELLGDKTPEERHAAFIAWIDQELASVD